MKTLFRKLLLVSACVASGALAQPASNNLDELYQRVKENRFNSAAQDAERIAAFTADRNRQQQLLQSAQRELENLEATGKRLQVAITDNNNELNQLEEQLKKDLGNFDELFGVTRQVASETRGQISDSLISAQFPGRQQGLDAIAGSTVLPTMEQLRGLWSVLLQEQMEQGKVARFNTFISNEQGFPAETSVFRVGPFVAASEKEFLVYNSAADGLVKLARQPAANHVKTISALESASSGEVVDITIDPSRGVILGLLVQSPNLIERFHQGGLPGYIVSILAVIGILIGIQRLISLWWTGLRVRKQMSASKAVSNNPLGRVLRAYDDNPSVDVETLERKLEDAVLKEIPLLERGLNTLKVLAAVAPLMGLLGTVVGMILTFQTITLWGTGEPKLMAGGISQALVTTVQGLVAAIPLLLLHSMASGRARLLQQLLEEQSAGLVARRAEAAHRGE